MTLANWNGRCRKYVQSPLPYCKINV